MRQSDGADFSGNRAAHRIETPVRDEEVSEVSTSPSENSNPAIFRVFNRQMAQERKEGSRFFSSCARFYRDSSTARPRRGAGKDPKGAGVIPPDDAEV